MFKELKLMLINQTEKLCELLELYEFCKITYKQREIRFARNDEGGLNISIRLENNDGLMVTDFARGVFTDIFAYIMQERGVKLGEVLRETKRILNLDGDWAPRQTVSLFEGIYDRLMSHDDGEKIKTYPESILDDYDPCGNLRWLRDGITLEAQRFYNVGMSIEENRITFPWRNQLGEIIAVKGRINEDNVDKEVPKYLYLVRNNISKALFNYSECYDSLACKEVYIFESEKSCMKLWGWGIKNTVAVGSHTLSPEQARLIIDLYPTKIHFMLDRDLDIQETYKNYQTLVREGLFPSTPCDFWDWSKSELPEKSAPCDGTKEQWEYILNKEMKAIKEVEDDEDNII